LLVVLGGAAVSACGASVGSASSSGVAPTASAPRAAACEATGSTTLAANKSVRVFALHETVYGCSRRSDKRYRLGRSTVCVGSERAGPVVVAGDEAAYALERCGVDTGFSAVIVRRFSDGKTLRSDPAITGKLGVESYSAVDSLVLKPDGAVAWIATGSSIIRNGAPRREVHKDDRTGQALLDSGMSVGPRSLRLRGSRATWKHGGAVRSTTLG
jgi:hypothetical protein